MKKPSLLTVLFGLLLSDLCMAADAETHAIPFRLHGGYLIVVQGSIGPLTGLNLVIDTGSSSSVISERVAKRLKLKGHTRKVLALGKRVPIQEVVLPVLQIGSLQFREVPAWVRSLSGLERRAESPLRVDALIGLDLLKRTDLTIDYEAGKLIFGPVTHSEQVLAFYKDLPFLTVHLRVAGQPLRLLLDSGAGQLILFERRTAGRLSSADSHEITKLFYAGGEIRLKKIHLENAALGNSKWVKLSAFLLEGPVENTVTDGVLGLSTLGLKRIQFDFQNGLLSWEK